MKWLWIFPALVCAWLLAGCPRSPDSCTNSISGSDIQVTQACGGSGDHAAGSVVTPAPVVVPPVVVTNPTSTP